MITPVPEVAALTAYASPQPVAGIDLRLDGTERPLPLPVGEAASYPKATELEAALAQRLDLPKDRVLVTAGADEALDRICRAYLSSARAAVTTAPTFEMIRHYAKLAGSALREVPWYDDKLELAALLEATQGMRGIAAVATPNNPTGVAVDHEVLVELARHRPEVLVVADLAYIEFAAVDPTKDLAKHDNVVMTRTFSKAWGIPGARVGYAVGPPSVIAAMRVAGGPYSVARPSLALALERLRGGEAEMRAYVAKARDEVKRMSLFLAKHGITVPVSQANFVLLTGPKVPRLSEALAKRGIGLRAFPNDPHLAQARRMVMPADDPTYRRLEGALGEAFAELHL